MMIVKGGRRDADITTHSTVAAAECMGLSAGLALDAHCHQDSLQSKGAYSVPSLWAMTLTSWYGTNTFP